MLFLNILNNKNNQIKDINKITINILVQKLDRIDKLRPISYKWLILDYNPIFKKFYYFSIQIFG